MSTPVATLPWTADDYLAWEHEQSERHEWDGSSVVAVTGARVRHARVVGNVFSLLRAQLPSGCEAFSEALKLRAGCAIRYPDVLVVCAPDLDPEAEVVDDAVFLVEVLSPSTARIDRGAKLTEYAHVPSLEGYLIVDPARRHLELYRREGGQLVPVATADVGGETIAPFGAVVLPVDDIYEGVL